MFFGDTITARNFICNSLLLTLLTQLTSPKYARGSWLHNNKAILLKQKFQTSERYKKKISYSMCKKRHLLPPPYETLEPVFVNAGFLELGPGSGDSALCLLDALGFSSSSDSDVSPGESVSPSLYLQH